MATEGMREALAFDVPYFDRFVFRASCKQLAIRAEANGSYVEVTVLGRFVRKGLKLVTSLNIVDLSAAVASRGKVLAIVTKSDTTDDAGVIQSASKLNVEVRLYIWIVDDIPIGLFVGSGLGSFRFCWLSGRLFGWMGRFCRSNGHG